jgi:hypothetical protein
LLLAVVVVLLREAALVVSVLVRVYLLPLELHIR